MITGRAKAYSSSCPQAVTHRSTNQVRRRVTSLQPKRVTNYATPPTPVPWRHLVNDIDCVAALNRQKNPLNPLFWRSRSVKVIEFSANREPVYDFLLAINSNLGLISYSYWDTTTYWPKIANFTYPLSFSALVRGDPLRIYGKALRFLKLVFQAADGEDLVILTCTVFAWSTGVTDRQTDRRTDGITMAKTHWKQ